MSYFDISGAVFNNQLRELETSDPAHADVFNAVFRQLINNDVALMEAASMFAGEKNKQAEFILNLKRTGKKYGVHHSAFDVSPLSAGTRTLDAVGMVAQPSTNTVRGRNDFEGESVFYGLEVNGHVDDAGEFIVEYIKGIDNEFSRTERDTWMLCWPRKRQASCGRQKSDFFKLHQYLEEDKLTAKNTSNDGCRVIRKEPNIAFSQILKNAIPLCHMIKY